MMKEFKSMSKKSEENTSTKHLEIINELRQENMNLRRVIDELKHNKSNSSDNFMDLLTFIIAGIVLTGGGSQLRHLKQLVEYITGMDTRVGYPGEHLSGESNEFNPIYSTAVGLLMKAIDNNSENLVSEISNSTGNDLVNHERKTILAKWGEGFKKFIDNVDNTYDN